MTLFEGIGLYAYSSVSEKFVEQKSVLTNFFRKLLKMGTFKIFQYWMTVFLP